MITPDEEAYLKAAGWTLGVLQDSRWIHLTNCLSCYADASALATG